MSRASKRITINVDGIPRTLFSIAERPKGDVYIIHRAIGPFSPMVSHAGSAIAEQHNTRLIEDRISIHESKYSDDAVNVVKYTLAFENNASYSSVHYTHAIKSGSGASYLFTRRYPNLRNHFYNSIGDGTLNIEVGLLQPILLYNSSISFCMCA